MTYEIFIEKIMVLFQGKYDGPYLDEIRRAIEPLTEESIERVYANLRDTVDRTGRLVFAKLKQAINSHGEYKKRERVRPGYERVTCDFCGESFNYNVGSPLEDYADFQVSANCPRCGWNHADTEWAERWARSHQGRYPDNYAALKAKHVKPTGRFYDLSRIQKERRESWEPVERKLVETVRDRSAM